MLLNHIFVVTDFTSRVSCGHSDREGMANEQGQDRLLTTVRISSPPRISQVRPQVSGRLQGLEFLLPRPVSLHGLRAVDLSGGFARHRYVPADRSPQVVSQGH